MTTIKTLEYHERYQCDITHKKLTSIKTKFLNIIYYKNKFNGNNKTLEYHERYQCDITGTHLHYLYSTVSPTTPRPLARSRDSWRYKTTLLIG